MKKTAIVAVAICALAFAFIEVYSMTGFAVNNASLVSAARASDYYTMYAAKMKNISNESVVQCSPYTLCPAVQRAAEKFSWPVQDYWVVAFSGEGMIMEFVLDSRGEIYYQHIGPDAVFS